MRIRTETEGAALTDDDQSNYARAKAMRHRMTPPEARLWVNVRRKSLGASIRRQRPVGPYVLDFYCPKARLAIEVDGEPHGNPDQQQHDGQRDAWLAAQGIAVLRFRAIDIRDDLDAVLEQLEREIDARGFGTAEAPPPPSSALRAPDGPPPRSLRSGEEKSQTLSSPLRSDGRWLGANTRRDGGGGADR